jgi:catechol 2,3-dioxygenase-like lactoylglutathione lyase family enzyme
MTEPLDSIDHLAIEATDIDETVDWYRRNFTCTVAWQDDSWAMLEFANIRLAIVTPGKHPPHIAFVRDDASLFGDVVEHRDGSRSAYTRDCAGNAIEIVEPPDSV